MSFRGFSASASGDGGGALSSPGPLRDVFVVKLPGADGSHAWSTSFTGVPPVAVALQRLVRVAAGGGSVFVLGRFDDTIDLDGGLGR